MKLLFEPLQIGSVTIPNRICMPAFGLKYCGIDRRPGRRLVDFYEARAAGGCGLLIVGGVGIDLVGSGLMTPSIEDDSFIPDWTRLAAAVHRHGSRLFLQLFHAGRYQHSMMAKGQQSVAPSAVASRYTRETPRELTVAEIEEIEEAFAQAALRARKAGADGIELIASAGYLVCQFLSPLTNLRNDRYGGSLENRLRFATETLARVRSTVGPDFPITMRISGSEFMSGGNGSLEMVEICRHLEAAGVQAFNVTGGWHETSVPQLPTLVPRNAFAYLASEIRKAVQAPVFASNRIVDPDQAESLLRQGICDMVCVGRAQIADPEWSAKAKRGAPESIRPCVGCLQGCLERLFRVQDVQCLCNPQAGFEEARALRPAAARRRVMVIGAGPAGMEAALTAKRRGHEVLLFDSRAAVGGQLPLVAAPPGRAEFAALQHYYEHELVATGLPVSLGVEVGLSTVRKVGPDVVVLASGSRPIVPSLPGVELPHVVGAWDFLLGKAHLGRRVVVLGGGAVGVETALAIAAQGTLDGEALKFLMLYDAEPAERLRELAARGTREVTILEKQPRIGADIGPGNRWVFLKELSMRQVKVETNAEVTAITGEEVLIRREGREERVPADSVVLALGTRSESALAGELEAAGIEVKVVGDARRPRTILEATHEGFLAGLEL